MRDVEIFLLLKKKLRYSASNRSAVALKGCSACSLPLRGSSASRVCHQSHARSVHRQRCRPCPITLASQTQSCHVQRPALCCAPSPCSYRHHDSASATCMHHANIACICLSSSPAAADEKPTGRGNRLEFELPTCRAEQHIPVQSGAARTWRQAGELWQRTESNMCLTRTHTRLL